MKQAIFKLDINSHPEDGMFSVFTGCVDGNGLKKLAVISENKLYDAAEGHKLCVTQIERLKKEIKLENERAEEWKAQYEATKKYHEDITDQLKADKAELVGVLEEGCKYCECRNDGSCDKCSVKQALEKHGKEE